MSSDNISHPPVKDCADKVNAKYSHGRPFSSWFARATRSGRRYRRAGGQRRGAIATGAMPGHNADPAVRADLLEDMFLPPDLPEWALNVVVVR